jgi:hypothetical protein
MAQAVYQLLRRLPGLASSHQECIRSGAFPPGRVR